MDERASTARHGQSAGMDQLDNMVRELRASAQPAKDGEPTTTRASRPKRKVVLPTGRRRALWLAAGVTIGLVLVISMLPTHSPQTKVLAPVTASPSAIPAMDSATAFVAAPTPLQWKAVVEQLDLRRGLAFMHAEPMELFVVDATQSPAFNTDQSMVRAMVDAGVHASSFPMRVTSVRELFVSVGTEPLRAMLSVTDTLGAYNLVNQEGSVVRRVAARGERTWKVELIRSPMFGWVYFSAISAASQ